MATPLHPHTATSPAHTRPYRGTDTPPGPNIMYAIARTKMIALPKSNILFRSTPTSLSTHTEQPASQNNSTPLSATTTASPARPAQTDRLVACCPGERTSPCKHASLRRDSAVVESQLLSSVGELRRAISQCAQREHSPFCRSTHADTIHDNSP